MVRAIKKSTYDSIPSHVKPKLCVVTMPVIVSIANEDYVLTEEACFFGVIDLISKRAESETPLLVKKKRKPCLED